MKTETKHTPGPWAAELANPQPSSGQTFWHVVEDKPRPYRDSVVQLFWKDGIRPTDEANARLIAAAPELLEALIEASHLICCCNRVVGLNKENYPHRSPTWAYDHPDTPIKLAMNNLLDAIDKCSTGKARAALAKAKGEA